MVFAPDTPSRLGKHLNLDIFKYVLQLVMKVWFAKSKRTEERTHGRTDKHRKKLDKKPNKLIQPLYIS